MARLCLALGLLASGSARAHDVYADVGVHGTRASETNPRSGSLTTSVSGTIEFSEQVSAWAGFAYTRDFATSTPEEKTAGSNVFLVSAGVAWLITDHWSTLLGASFAPAATIRSATTVDAGDGRTADVVVRSVDRSFGGSAFVSYLSAGLSDFEWAVDLSVGATRFDTAQQLEVPTTVRGAVLRTSCERNPLLRSCALVNGVTASVWQVRLGGAFIATLFDHADLGLELAGFLYDKDPTSIGFFTVAVLGQSADLGNGVPVAPYLATARPSFAWRFSRLTLKASYQLGLYAAGLGVNHLVAVKATVHLTRKLHLAVAVSGQVDGGGLNLGGAVVTGLLVEF